MAEPLRVVLADDHPVVRDGLAALLGSVPAVEVVGTAATGRQAVRAAVTLRPDVLVLDVQMPDLDALPICPGPPVFQLTLASIL